MYVDKGDVGEHSVKNVNEAVYLGVKISWKAKMQVYNAVVVLQ